MQVTLENVDLDYYESAASSPSKRPIITNLFDTPSKTQMRFHPISSNRVSFVDQSNLPMMGKP